MSHNSTPDASAGSEAAAPLHMMTEDLGFTLVMHLRGELDMNNRLP